MQLTCKIPVPGQLTVLKPYKANSIHNEYGKRSVRVRNDAGAYTWYGEEYFEPYVAPVTNSETDLGDLLTAVADFARSRSVPDLNHLIQTAQKLCK